MTRIDDCVAIILLSLLCSVLVACRHDAGRPPAALAAFCIGIAPLYFVTMPLSIILSLEAVAVLIAVAAALRCFRVYRQRLVRVHGEGSRYCQRCGDIVASRDAREHCRECGAAGHIPLARVLLGHASTSAMRRVVARRRWLVLGCTLTQAMLLCFAMFFLKSKVDGREAEFLTRWSLFGVIVMLYGVLLVALLAIVPITTPHRRSSR